MQFDFATLTYVLWRLGWIVFGLYIFRRLTNADFVKALQDAAERREFKKSRTERVQRFRQQLESDGIEDDGSPDLWIRAANAVKLLTPAFDKTDEAQDTITTRAYNGLIRARAEQVQLDNEVLSSRIVPSEFWNGFRYCRDRQNWTTGDFINSIDLRTDYSFEHRYMRVFGVKFLRADIEKMVSASLAEPPAAKGAPGRPRAEWCDDLWIEICRQLYVGQLHPKMQSDIAKAMLEWLAEQKEAPAESTIKERARKLWTAIGGKN